MIVATPLEVARSFGFSDLGEFAAWLGTLSEPERDAILGLLEE